MDRVSIERIGAGGSICDAFPGRVAEIPGVHRRGEKPPLARRWKGIVLLFAAARELDGCERGRERFGTGAERSAGTIFGFGWRDSGESLRRDVRRPTVSLPRLQYLARRCALDPGDELGRGVEEAIARSAMALDGNSRSIQRQQNAPMRMLMARASWKLVPVILLRRLVDGRSLGPPGVRR